MVDDDPRKFWGGLVGLGTGREDDIIRGMGSIYLAKLELQKFVVVVGL